MRLLCYRFLESYFICKEIIYVFKKYVDIMLRIFFLVLIILLGRILVGNKIYFM